VPIDPSDHTVDELNTEIEDVEDIEGLWALLEAEKSGKDRKTAKEAIERRIDAVEDAEGDGPADDGGVDAPLDPGEYEIADLGPKIQDVEDLDGLQAILAAEEGGEDRAPVKQLVESRTSPTPSGTSTTSTNWRTCWNRRKRARAATASSRRSRIASNRSRAPTRTTGAGSTTDRRRRNIPSSTTRPSTNSTSAPWRTASTATCGCTARPSRAS